MRVLITRPEADSGALRDALAARGVEALIEPMLSIRPIAGATVDLTGIQALLFTSANGVRAFAPLSPVRDLPVYAVGDATARAAGEAGFTTVASAKGDVDDLAALVRRRVDPAAGALLHVAGSAVAGNLAGALQADGYGVERRVLYETAAVGALSPAARQALNEESLDGVLFFSPRTARTFVTLVANAALNHRYRTLHAYCLSAAVADEVRDRPWAGLTVADAPTQDALLALFAPMTDTPQDAASPASRIIAAFGGIRPMAAKLDIAVTTVQGWKERDAIPAARRAEIEAAAGRHNIALDAADLNAMADAAPASSAATTAGGAATAAGAATAGGGDKSPPASKAAATPAAAPAKRGRGGLWLIGVLVFIAIAVAVAADRAGYFGSAPPTAAADRAALAALGDRLGAVEKKVDAVAAAPAPADPSDRIAALDARLAKLEQAPPAATVDLGPIEDRLAKLEQAPAAADGASVDLGPIEERLTMLEQAPATVGDAMADLGPLEARLGELEQRIAALAETIGAVEGQAVPTSDTDTTAALREEIAALDAGGKQLAADLQAVREEIGGMAGGTMAAPVAATATTRLIFDAGRLRRAVAAGRAYADPLQALQGGLPADAGVAAAFAALAPHAAAGVPTTARIAADFEAVADAVLSARPQAEAGDWLDAALLRLQAIVTVRRVDGAPGIDNPGAVVTATRAALQDGRLADAADTLAVLTPWALAEVDGWLAAARMRLAVDAAVDTVEAAVAAGEAGAAEPADATAE